MSFLTQSLRTLARQQLLINNLTTSFRSLSVTPSLAQRHNKPRCQIATPLSELTLTPNVPTSITAAEEKTCRDIFTKVNEQLATGEQGRLFAVVQLCGKQFKITEGDIILVEGYWPPNVGDEIRLEKVLLAGARDFTLIGRPILAGGLVNIKATIIEKTLTHTKTHFKKKRRKQYTRINFQRSPNTMIRINTIEVTRKVDTPVQEANENRVF